ncbi:hypothetical protein [Desertivirga xinjiangensis]|uniref:hypothetical protein n=1 Tax=Desertivirga xinjiangensis TaxID=539206 RepID=UPI002108EC9C|nr:hypothetical protein [Pedobacter xinjiangensis]
MPLLFQLQFTTPSVLWIVFSLILGLGYAALLYKSPKAELSTGLTRLLFVLRAVVVALICFLFFAPYVKTTNKILEKPLVFLLQDNSASISIARPAGFDLSAYSQQLKNLETSLKNDYDVRTLSFGSKVSEGLSSEYPGKGTNISAALKYINEGFSNRNIGAVILASDGIYNQGGNPQYIAKNIKSPIYTIALGDTIPKKDLLISNVNYNKLVYLGNDFQIELNIEAHQSKGSAARIIVTGQSGPLFTKSISINSNEYRASIPVTLSARKKGIQRFTATITGIPGELSRENNTQTFFIEVIDGRQQVFILAASPHPDIAALKQSIESNKNYEVKSGFINDFNRGDLGQADLTILHQIPSLAVPGLNLSSLLNKKNVWYILGAQSNTQAFASSQNVLNIVSAGAIQEVFPTVNPQFYEFTLSESTAKKLSGFPPLLSPFGNYTLKSQASVLLTQKIGKLDTDRPLLAFSSDGTRKTAVLSGEGIWRWRLEDFKENGDHAAIDELLSKAVQFLSSKEDKRKFRVYAGRNSFDEGEHIVLNAELYNDAYELVNTPEARVVIKDRTKSYPFTFSRTDKSYILDAGALPPGEYSFNAQTQLGKIKYTAGGQFVITQQQAELSQTTADHQVLFNLADQSGAKLILPSEIKNLPALIKENELVKTISWEDKRFEELINIKWIFALILTLISLEWFGRKRNGTL